VAGGGGGDGDESAGGDGERRCGCGCCYSVYERHDIVESVGGQFSYQPPMPISAVQTELTFQIRDLGGVGVSVRFGVRRPRPPSGSASALPSPSAIGVMNGRSPRILSSSMIFGILRLLCLYSTANPLRLA